jgi:hypothetical protein
MKSSALLLAAVFFLFPSLSSAQTTGRVECPRDDGYIYLYSSMTTLDVRTTLQCGEIVQITGRYDTYFAARTAKGGVGYVPISAIVLLKDQVGAGIPEPATLARERTPYDERPKPPPVAANRLVPAFALPKDTPVRVRLLKPLSSASAHTGDAVEFEVVEDVLVDGLTVIAEGAKASGTVAEVEAKKHFGHDGKVSFNITSVHLANNESAPLRCYFEAFGTSNTSSNVQIGSGKDALIAQGTEFTARVESNVGLKRETFATGKDSAAAPSADATHSPQSHR